MRSKRNNDNNKRFESWEMICIQLCSFARGCSCFNSFYIVLNVFGSLYCFLRKGLREVKARNLILKERDLIPSKRNLILRARGCSLKERNLIPAELYMREIFTSLSFVGSVVYENQ